MTSAHLLLLRHNLAIQHVAIAGVLVSAVPVCSVYRHVVNVILPVAVQFSGEILPSTAAAAAAAAADVDGEGHSWLCATVIF